MVSQVHLTPVFNPPDAETETKKGGISSLLGRVVPSVEKTVLASNLILIIAAFAYAFFSLKLPLLGIGLCLYGVVTTTVLANKLNQAAKMSNEAQSLHETIEGYKGKSVLTTQAEEMGKKIEELQAEVKRLEGEVETKGTLRNRLRTEVENLKKQQTSLKSILRKRS